MTLAPTKPPATSQQHRALQERAARVASMLLASLVCWLLAAGRWGSYVGLPSHHIFVTDVVLVIAVALALPWLSTVRSLRHPARTLLRQWPSLLVVLLLVWCGARLAMGRLDATALRDAAPYLYAVAAVHVALVGLPPPRVTERLLVGAFIFHATWVSGSLIHPPHLPASDLSKVVPFVLRGDFDATVCGVAAAATLLVAAGRWKSWPRKMVAASITFIGWNLALALVIGSRAGLLAALVAMLAALAVVVARHRRLLFGTARRRWTSAVAGVLLVGAATVLLVVSPAGTRLVHGFDLSPESGVSGSESSGTARARQVVWNDVLRYIERTPSRTAVGVGFGPDFLKASGGLDALEGSVYTGVRAPHDYWLNTWARLGLVGLVLSGLVAAAVVFQAVARVATRTVAAPAACGTVIALVLALPVAASLGVILESPFGAVPYFWAVGAVIRSARR